MPIPSYWSKVLKLCYPSGLRYLKTEKALQKTPLSERLLKLLLWSHFKLHWCCAQSSHRLWVEHKTLGIIALSADVSQFPSSTMIFGNWSQIKQRYSKFKLMLEGTKASNSKSYTLLPLRLPLHIPELGIHISLRRYPLRKRQRSTNNARCTNATDRSQVFGRCNNCQSHSKAGQFFKVPRVRHNRSIWPTIPYVFSLVRRHPEN